MTSLKTIAAAHNTNVGVLKTLNIFCVATQVAVMSKGKGDYLTYLNFFRYVLLKARNFK